MLKYGLEYVVDGKSGMTVYRDDEEAKREAEARGAALKPGECLALFRIACDDATGRVASNQRRIVRTWKGA